MKRNWFRPYRVIILDKPPLPDSELAGAFGYALDEIRMRALLQIIGDLEKDAVAASCENVGNASLCANYLGGAEHLSMLRDQILDLQQKGFGSLPLDRN